MAGDLAVQPGLSVAGQQSRDLTVFTVRGHAVPDDVVVMFQAFVARPTPRVLWDMREAGIAHFGDDELRHLVSQLLRLQNDRRLFGRSAFVCSRDADCRVMRMLIDYAEANDYGIRLALFRDLDDARCWLAEV